MDNIEIVARHGHVAGDYDRIESAKTYAEAFGTLEKRVLDKHPSYRERANRGARLFAIRDVKRDVDLKIVTIDDAMEIVEASDAEIAENAILANPQTIAESVNTSYDDWAVRNGLHQAPGSVRDLYDAAIRIRAKADIGLTMTIAPRYVAGDVNSYEAMVVTSNGKTEAEFFGEGLSEDLRDAQRWAEHHGFSLSLDQRMTDFAAEDGLSLAFDHAGRPVLEAGSRAFDLDRYDGGPA